jgi:hypothetical protein
MNTIAAPIPTVLCVRCEQTITVEQMPESCLRSPDGGPHEGVAPRSIRQSGWSLHVAGCPRATPFMVGADIVDAACICRTAGLPEGTRP